MRSIIQRVSHASVQINGKEYASIEKGMLVLLGIEDADTREDSEWLAGKIYRLRIFNDRDGLMNHSISDLDGELMVISQFTLFASTRKGNRPSYIRAAKPEHAIPVYENFIQIILDI